MKLVQKTFAQFVINPKNLSHIDDGKISKTFPMKINELDKASIVIMLALSEYLNNVNQTIEDLFQNKVRKQMIRTKSKQQTIDILETEDFFKTLKEIEINIKNDVHDKLKKFLCLDQKYQDKIHFEKLSKLIKVFLVNDELRKYAKKCQEELSINVENT